MTRRHLACAALTILLGVAAVAARQAGSGGEDGAESRDMRLVGHNDLQGRSAYQPIIINQDGRHIAYVGHHNRAPINIRAYRSSCCRQCNEGLPHADLVTHDDSGLVCKPPQHFQHGGTLAGCVAFSNPISL